MIAQYLMVETKTSVEKRLDDWHSFMHEFCASIRSTMAFDNVRKSSQSRYIPAFIVANQLLVFSAGGGGVQRRLESCHDGSNSSQDSVTDSAMSHPASTGVASLSMQHVGAAGARPYNFRARPDAPFMPSDCTAVRCAHVSIFYCSAFSCSLHFVLTCLMYHCWWICQTFRGYV